MAEIIPLPGDRHQETMELLPWYVNGRIEIADRIKVEAHLAECAACQAELAIERRLMSEVAGLTIDAEAGFAELLRRLSRDATAAAPAHRGRPAWSRPDRASSGQGRGRWMLVAQVAAALLVVVSVAAPMFRERPRAEYRTLGAAPAGQAGNLLVMFRPGANEQEQRRTLTESGARLVGGPTAAGAYMLAVPAAKRAAALVRLRAERDVVLAQPIDAAPHP